MPQSTVSKKRMNKSSWFAVLSILLIGGVLAEACNPAVRKIKSRDEEAAAGGEGGQSGVAGSLEMSSGGDSGSPGEPVTNGGSAGSGAGGSGTAGSASGGTAGVGGGAPSGISAGCGKAPLDADPDFTLPPNYDATTPYPVQLACAEGTPDTVCLATCEALPRLREEACVNLDPVAGCP